MPVDVRRNHCQHGWNFKFKKKIGYVGYMCTYACGGNFVSGQGHSPLYSWLRTRNAAR